MLDTIFAHIVVIKQIKQNKEKLASGYRGYLYSMNCAIIRKNIQIFIVRGDR